ncbi:MAG: lamin tail domain-containing protein [bacterium]
MKAKITFILVFSFLFFGFSFVHAEVIINEVQIKPVGESFIELYNSGDASVDLTGWSIKRKTTSGTEYSLVSQSRLLGKIISASSYFLLVNEGSYTGSTISDATWATSYSLANDNAITLYNGSNIVSKTGWGDININDCDITCAPNPADGQSVQKSSTSWIVAIPTPKMVNGNSSVVVPVVTSSGGVGLPIIPTTTTEVKPKVIEIPKIKTKIIAKTLAYVGIPIDLEVSTLGYSGELLRYGKYYWNFGDGDSREVNANQNIKFSHTYYYEGDYEITLEYYSNAYGDIPDTVNKFVVKVIPATISISKVGDEKDFFIELSNNSDYDIDISKWLIASFSKSFVLPKNTNFGSKSKMILSPKVTNFTVEDKKTLKLFKPTGEIAFDFSTPAEIKVNPVLLKTNSNKADEASVVVEKNNNIQPEIVVPDLSLQKEIEKPNIVLAAAPILSETDQIKDKNTNKSYFFFWGFVVLLFISGGVVYYIRQGKNVSKVGDDFKIIDE